MAKDRSCQLWAQATTTTVNSGFMLLRPGSRVAHEVVDSWRAMMPLNADYDQTYLQAVLLDRRKWWCCDRKGSQDAGCCVREDCGLCLPHGTFGNCSGMSCARQRTAVRGKAMWSKLNDCFSAYMRRTGWRESSPRWGGLCLWSRQQRVNPHDMGVQPWRPCDWMNHVNRRYSKLYYRVIAPANRSINSFRRFREWTASIPFSTYEHIYKAFENRSTMDVHKLPPSKAVVRLRAFAAQPHTNATFAQPQCRARPFTAAVVTRGAARHERPTTLHATDSTRTILGAKRNLQPRRPPSPQQGAEAPSAGPTRPRATHQRAGPRNA